MAHATFDSMLGAKRPFVHVQNADPPPLLLAQSPVQKQRRNCKAYVKRPEQCFRASKGPERVASAKRSFS